MWLDRRVQDPTLLAPLLRPAPVAGLQAWPVSRTVSRGSAEARG